jgi:hypothetical protein
MITIAMVLAPLVGGCEPEIRVVRSSWDNFPADPKPKQAKDPDPYRDPAGGQGWSIRVVELDGTDRHGKARGLIQELRNEAKLSDIWMQDYDGVVSVYHGRFATAADPAIRPALGKIQAVRVDGEMPFADCQLVPLIGDGRVIADPFDLRQFIGYYSLQIGFYDASYEGDFRAAAEEAVRSLREDGFDAYYYHGPYRSIVSIGVFSYEQAFVSAGTHDTYAPSVRELQQRFPFNLGNGVTLIQKDKGRVIGEQKSSLIRVF